jgi:hypothetical protein
LAAKRTATEAAARSAIYTTNMAAPNGDHGRKLSGKAVPRQNVGRLSDYEQNDTDDRTYLIETLT